MDSIPTRPSDKDKRNTVYVAANGSRTKNTGTKGVQFRSGKGGGIGAMAFQLTNVRKPLASVRRTVERGNRVLLGGGCGQSYIEGSNGKKVMLNEKNGVYALAVEFLQDLNNEGFTRQAWVHLSAKRL